MARIALEARAVSSAHGGGVRRYAVEVIRRLLPLRSPHEFHVFLDRARYRGTFSGATEHVIPVGHELLRLPWDGITLPLAIRRANVDLVHYFKPATTVIPLPRTIATIHDIIPLLFPQVQTPIQRAYWRLQLPLVARRCTHLLTLSEHSKRDIVRVLQVPPERITVTPLGVDESFAPRPPEETARVRKRYDLQRPYFLNVGTIEPRKNLIRLLHAFELIMDRVPHDLVLAGKWGWRSEDVRTLLSTSRFSQRVRYCSYVDSQDLPALYAGADAFVFPSIYEGFGLPLLEAMACGTPVVSSNVSSIPEVVGPHALLVSPEDVSAIADAMERIVMDRSLHERLQKEGNIWARQFTWDRTAEQTLAVYNKVLAQ